MKSRLKIWLVLILILIAVACEKDSPEQSPYSFTGRVQKGPFITGTTVQINELNQDLGQTGKSFITTVIHDNGTFELNNVELASSMVLLTANGSYFNELFGEISGSSLTLQAIADLRDQESVNINVMTHLSKARIEKLVSDGLDFDAAKDQAENELLEFLGVSDEFHQGFENLDLAQKDDLNGILLAFSILVQRYTWIWNERPTMVGELIQLLTNMQTDFRDDGIIDDKESLDALMINLSRLSLLDIRDNIEYRYSHLYGDNDVPDFKKYISDFQMKNCEEVYTEAFFPDSASPDLFMAPTSMLPNLLCLDDSVFKAGKSYSMAAISPLHGNLMIRFSTSRKTVSPGTYLYGFGGPIYGWKHFDNENLESVFVSQIDNQLLSYLVYLNAPGVMELEYYINDTITPAFVRKIRWE